MRVVKVANYMGGKSRRAGLGVWRRFSLFSLLHEYAHTLFHVVEDETFGAYLIRHLQEQACTPEELNRRNKSAFLAKRHEECLKELKNAITHRREKGLWHKYVRKVGLFLATLRNIQIALFAASRPDFPGIWNLRGRIKALNPPKNLFPQSLRPVKAAAL